MATILLAEDEDGLRMLLRRQLTRAGHTVVECGDGLEALEALATQPIDLVVSDMKMPRIDGMGLLNAARERGIDVDFVVLTGHGSLEGAVEAFKTGVVRDYLLKPLDDIQTLNVVVDRTLERRQLQRDNTRLVVELQQRVEELEEARQRLVQMAEEDALTGLLNYRGIDDRLIAALDSGNTRPIAVVLLDVDRFKSLNDLYGHPFGDRALCLIADALRHFYRQDAFIGRCGGDEFMVVLPGATASEAASRAWQVQDHLQHHPLITPDNLKIPLGLCFGIADTVTVGCSEARLVSAADVALYQGKERGRGQITLHGGDTFRSGASPEDTHPIAELFARLDTGSRDHSEHMTRYAHELARYVGLSDDACEAISVAGLLHDIGKIAVPDAVLLKPGALTPTEYEQVKTHVLHSAQIVRVLPQIDQVLAGVAHHHERWDGKGYPNGLRETEIPLLGRILAIADAFSAMVISRPYRAAMGVDEALAEIEAGAGTQFDPGLATGFVAMVRSGMIEPLAAAA
jgi:diguanylate cyclase (GGDEF)-like protein